MRPGWYFGHVAEVLPDLGLARLQGKDGTTILAPLLKFPLTNVLGTPIQFKVGDFGGVTEVLKWKEDYEKQSG